MSSYNGKGFLVTLAVTSITQAITLTIITIVAVVWFSTASTRKPPAPKVTPIKHNAQKWEYAAQYMPDATMTAMLGSAGASGWEAIWCRRARSGDDKDVKWGYECLFKRPVK